MPDMRESKRRIAASVDRRIEEADREYDEAMTEDVRRRAIQCTVIAGHLAKEQRILVTPDVVEYVLLTAEHLGFIDEWVSWQEE